MLIIKCLFWIAVALDVAVLGLFAVLSLAAAGSSRTNPIAALWIPAAGALVLAGAILLFLRTNSLPLRLLAFVVAASPVLIAVAGRGWAEMQMSQYVEPGGEMAYFPAGPLREIEKAIERSDAPAVAEAAARAGNVNQIGRAGVTLLLLAVLKLRDQPDQFDVIRALLKAGADPNVAGSEPPLAEAIAASRKSGAEPVRLLLAAGARPDVRGEYGEPAYYIAASTGIDVEVLRLMLDRGASPKDPKLLLTAVNTRNWKAALLLLERGSEWRKFRAPNGFGLRERLDSEARTQGDGNGLAELIRFVQAAGE